MLATCEATVFEPEDSLLTRCRAGDLDAFGQVYAQYERQVFRYAWHLLGNADDADDVKQDTFLRAYRAISGFRNDCSLRTWLLRICTNLCRDRIKSQSRRREVLFDPHEAPQDLMWDDQAIDPHELAERSQMADVVRAALGGMPSDQRHIIVLREIEDLSYEEIADVIGCSRASVKLRLFRARQRLRERVESMLKPRR